MDTREHQTRPRECVCGKVCRGNAAWATHRASCVAFAVLPPPPAGFKVCTKCQEDKELRHFVGDKQKKDGLSSTCRVCDSKRRIGRAEQSKKQAAIWSTEKRTEIVARQRAWRAKHPQRLKAHRMLWDALKRKAIVPWPVCAIPECSDTKVQGHHPDYSAPLDVTWLCAKHHAEVHQLSRDIQRTRQ